jgi:membrane-bound serine protease (ClpP class)
LIVGVSVATGALFFAVLIFALRAQATPVWMGQESMVGRVGLVRESLSPAGQIQLGGEQWTAELVDGGGTAGRGSKVEVVRVEGLKLFVRVVEG